MFARVLCVLKRYGRRYQALRRRRKRSVQYSLFTIQLVILRRDFSAFIRLPPSSDFCRAGQRWGGRCRRRGRPSSVNRLRQPPTSTVIIKSTVAVRKAELPVNLVAYP